MRHALPEGPSGSFTPLSIRLVGLGSPNGGDDQVGLVAATHLRAVLPPQIDVTTDTAGGARIVDLGEGIHTLILLDALAATPDWPVGTHARWRYPNDRDQLETATLRGTHSVSVVQGLDLAHALDRLPRLVLIHALAVRNFEPGASVSPELEQPLHQWIQLIRSEALHQLSSVQPRR